MDRKCNYVAESVILCERNFIRGRDISSVGGENYLEVQTFVGGNIPGVQSISLAKHFLWFKGD